MQAVIDTQASTKLIGSTNPFILVLKKGEGVIESILTCVKLAKINAASLSGLGAIENPTIAYYNLETKQYQNQTYAGIFELTSLNGNIGKTEENETVAHVHVNLADDKHQVIGGHLMKEIVGVTVEITVIPLQGTVIRKFDAEMGLKLIATD